MEILLVKKQKETLPLYSFIDSISAGLWEKIGNKFQSYVELGDIYHGKQLKSLNSKIWKYKGTIYKLRVDQGKESARVLFVKMNNGDLTIIHCFLKSTQKTPKKEAHQAISIYNDLNVIETLPFNAMVK